MALPGGYTQVEYLESTGTQYIDTGYKPNQDSRIIFDAQMLEGSAPQKTCCFFGCRDGTNFWEIYKASNTGQQMYHFWGPTYGPYWTIDYTARHTMELNKNVGIFDGSELTYSYTTFQLNYNVFLGADNSSGFAASITAMKIYSCQIYDNSTLVRDFIPAIRTSDGVAGLYDTANDVFYVNAGTGVFVAGPYVGPTGSRTLIEAVGREIKTGNVILDGAVYNIAYGEVMDDGTVYEIAFAPKTVKITITGSGLF